MQGLLSAANLVWSVCSLFPHRCILCREVKMLFAPVLCSERTLERATWAAQVSKRTGLHVGTYESLEFQSYLYLHGENKVWCFCIAGRFWGSFLEISAVHELRITAESLLVGLKLWVFLGLVLLHVRVGISEIPPFMTFDPFFWISCVSWLDELFVY